MVAPLRRRSSKDRERIILVIVTLAFVIVAGGLYLAGQLTSEDRSSSDAWTPPPDDNAAEFPALQMGDPEEWRALMTFRSSRPIRTRQRQTFYTAGREYRLRYRIAQRRPLGNAVIFRGFDPAGNRTFEWARDEEAKLVGYLRVFTSPGEQTLEVISRDVRWTVEIDVPVNE